MSRHTVPGGDIAGLFSCFAALRQKAQRRMDKLYPLVVIQEAGLDGFWLGRVLSKEARIEGHIVEAASIAMPRRHRRAKTDRIDGETLVRALMAWKRGEPRACSMVKLLTPEEEDNRRLGRERKTLVAERVFHVNRIKGLRSSLKGYESIGKTRTDLGAQSSRTRSGSNLRITAPTSGLSKCRNQRPHRRAYLITRSRKRLLNNGRQPQKNNYFRNIFIATPFERT